MRSRPSASSLPPRPRASRAAHAVAAAALVAAPALALAQGPGHELSDDELGNVWGQALVSLTNQSFNGFDFSRLTLDGTVLLSANLTNLRLGEYTRTPDPSGVGADIDIGAIQFGRSDLDAAHRTVTITDPYVEFVYKDAGTGKTATREVVGMRLGFGGISGDIGLQMNAVSGSLLINTATGTVNSATDPNGGIRWTGGSTPLSGITGVTAGDANGASRDFFISVLKQAVTFPSVNGTAPTPATAQSGFWLNWTDRLTALGTPTMPPNTGKTGP